MKTRLKLLLLTLSLLAFVTLRAQDNPPASAPAQSQSGGAGAVILFSEVADEALLAMKKRAGELKMEGVAVVAFAEGDTVQSWSSKMLVVGRMKNAPADGKKGDNLLGIAYTKAAEMADTLKDSGSGIRAPMTGEYGWQGGVVAKTKSGIVIAAFSGGKSEDDVRASRAGLAVLTNHFK